jgi:hypothetical protein
VDGNTKEFLKIDRCGKAFGALEDETNFFLSEDMERRNNKSGMLRANIYSSSDQDAMNRCLSQDGHFPINSLFMRETMMFK